MANFPAGTVIALALGLWAASAKDPASRPADSPASNTPIFWVIPHTHWEGAVFKTREEYLEMGLPNLLTAVRLLKENPNYRFALDQLAYFKPFLERYPEEAAAFRKFIRDGRLQIVGGLNVMPDDNMPGGESFVRQILLGKGFCREKLGVEVKVGWLLDTFGHHAQMPQLLRLAGFQSFWFFRGVEDRAQMPSEFLWEGLDGTRIPAFWLPFAYGHLYGSPRDLPGFSNFMIRRYNALAPFSRGGDRVGLAGVDVSEPELHLPALVEQFNRQTNRPFELRLGVPTDFEARVTKGADRPVIKGERNPLFQGIYSSRIELKSWMRSMEQLLTTAEKTGVLASLLGTRPDESALWRAWEPVLFNVTHDLASGVMTDRVYEDTVRGYEFSRRLGDQLVDQNLDAILSGIDSRGDGVAVAVFNPLGWSRTDIVEVDLGWAAGGAKRFAISDPDGKPVPSQMIESERFADGAIKRARIAFIARDIPALGWSLYRVQAGSENNDEVRENAPGDFLENQFYRLTLDSGSGALTGLLVKEGNWQALAGPANVVAREPDTGDFWELYKNLDGFQNVIVTRPLPVPSGGQVHFSSAESGTNGVFRHGPVFSEFHVNHSFGTNQFATTIRLYAGLTRIDFETEILNNEKFVRYRMLVPTSITNGHHFQEIPFGAIERPTAQEFPAQNWIDYSDGARGVALLNRGLPGNNVASGTLMLSLLRSTRIQSYGIGGGYERQGSDSGLELGKRITSRYALLPHAGDWREARVFRAGLEFNQPLLARKVASHAGPLGKRWGLLESATPGVVLSALKPGRGGATIVRVYEAAGQPARAVNLRFHAHIHSAQESNLMEDDGRKMKSSNNTLLFDLHPFEIKTFKLKLGNPKQTR